MDFTGKKVLVTGHSRGIGKAIYELFRDNGAEVFGISSDQCDLTNLEETKNYVYLCNHDIDILVNCAGMNGVGKITDWLGVSMQHMMNINVYSPMIISKSLIPHMKKQKWGRIINIGSVYASKARTNRLQYVTSKHALLGLTRSMATDLHESGIYVNMVSPDVTDTDMTHQMLGEDANAAPLLSPADVADRVLKICESDIYGCNWEMKKTESGIYNTIT